MSQVGNALNMLILLKSRGKMKAKELADILEVKERTIRRYKEDLMCKFSNYFRSILPQISEYFQIKIGTR